MKSTAAIFLTLMIVFCLTACATENGQSKTDISLCNESTASDDDNGHSESEENNILVVYFSATGTTKQIAEYAADILSADIYEIVPKSPYTNEDLNYYSGGRADREQENPAARPAISGSIPDIEQYDIVLLGYPIWHGQTPRIISTFLENCNFNEKTIVPFCTSHSSGIGSSASNLHSLAANAAWLDGKRFSSDAARTAVKEWLVSLGLISDTDAETGVFNF